VTRPLLDGRAHVTALLHALSGVMGELDVVEGWAGELAGVLQRGGRLLAAGNGGSAAQAQHLTGELVGRYRDDRPAYSAIALHADTSSLTAITNDYGGDQAFARQVRAHGRRGDVFVGISTSGRSPNVLAAAAAARDAGLRVWALTGPRPNPLADAADAAVAVDTPETATVQEAHLVLLHILCAAVDVELGIAPAADQARTAPPRGGGLSFAGRDA
jgi:phosphoheptose isomerase